MSPSPTETLEIAEAATRYNVLLTVCHVLRYAPFYRTLKEIVDQKKIGISFQFNGMKMSVIGIKHIVL